MAVLQGISVRNGFQAVIYAVLGAAAFGGCVKELEQATAADHNVYLVLEDAGDPACTTDARVAWVLVWDTGLADDGPAYTTVALLPQGPGKPSDPTVEGFGLVEPGSTAPVCWYSASTKLVGVPSSAQLSVTAIDEQSWVARCSAPLTPTPVGIYNVFTFRRGQQGCEPPGS